MTSAAALERNKTIVRSFKECQGTRDETAVMREILSPHYQRLRGGMANLAANARGAGFPETAHGLRAAFPDRVDVIEDIIAEGDRVGMIWRLQGTHRGTLFGIPGTGKTIDIWEIGVFRVIDGRIAEGWFMADEVGVLRQLGVNLPARPDGQRVLPAPPVAGEFAEDVLRRLEAGPAGAQQRNKIVVARSKTTAPPAADRTPAAQLVQIAQAFLQAYGTALSTANAAQLAGLYGADSVLCLDGQVAEGGANIAAQVITPRLAGGGISLRISKFDVQAVKATNQVLIFLTGEASAFPVSGAAPPLSRQPSRPRPPALPYPCVRAPAPPGSPYARGWRTQLPSADDDS